MYIKPPKAPSQSNAINIDNGMTKLPCSEPSPYLQKFKIPLITLTSVCEHSELAMFLGKKYNQNSTALVHRH
ncbi:hypothetical protein PM082_022841 [Marasmius tenuissimus]|nr:hypothetical protein PM082_022841 [Marasmius tenuissimus]